MKVIPIAFLMGVLFTPSVFTADCKEQSGSKIISISPTFISILGNKPIKVEGPFLNGAISVQFRFNDVTQTTVKATLINSVATCVAPFFYTNGRIQVDLLVQRTTTTTETFTGFIYTTQPKSEVTFKIVSKTDFTLKWETTNFGSGVSLNLELFELSGSVWTSRGVVKGGLPNTGSFSGQFNSNGQTVLQNIRNVYVVKLTQTTTINNPRQPRSVDECTAENICNSSFSDYLYSLGEKSEAELNDLCYSWYVQDPGAPKDALHCPPTVQKAQQDSRFEPVDDLPLYNPEADTGFRQRNPSPSGAGQRCVYKNGNLLVGPPSGGNVRSVSPNGKSGMNGHFVADLLPWYTCCALIKNQTACALYYERRPSDDGSKYVPPGSSCAYGDPHITTFDGFYYTFNGVGEFWLTKTVDKSFVMQCRTEPYVTPSGQKTTAAVITAVVMRQNNCGDSSSTVQLSIKEKNFQILLDGQEVSYDTRPNQPQRTIMYNGASIKILSAKNVKISFSSGYSFDFTQDLGVINMVTLVNVELKGKINALLGTYDGNQSNDFTLPNGNTVPINSSPEKIHDYGMQWGINAQDSLFTYPPCKNYTSYENKGFVPTFVTPNLDKLPPASVAACKGNNECLFDLAVTGNVEVAMTTLVTIQKYEVIVKISAVACGRPTNPPNGYVQANNYLAGSSAQLVCNKNYEIKGNPTTKCVKDASGQLNWEGALGTCVEVNKCANSNAWLQFICERGLPPTI